jgi:hypothetical protein
MTLQTIPNAQTLRTVAENAQVVVPELFHPDELLPTNVPALLANMHSELALMSSTLVSVVVMVMMMVAVVPMQ